MITQKQKRRLSKQVHHLKPVVTIGQAGLTEAVLGEIGVALNAHELIKIRVSAGDRAERDAMIRHILACTSADLVFRIGNIGAFFRPNPKKKNPMHLPAA
jgi:RNA-binding protein